MKELKRMRIQELKRMRIQAFRLEEDDQMFMKHLGVTKLNELKGKGQLRLYVTGHEGTSDPRDIDENKRVKLTWPRAAIRRLAETIKEGTKLFISHNKDNSIVDRPYVGSVLKSFTEMVYDKLYSFMISFIPNEKLTEAEGKNACSAESNVISNSDGVVQDVEETSGVAIESDSKATPAFRGAYQLAAVQCFNKTEETRMSDESTSKIRTLSEVIAASKEYNFAPSTIFGPEDVKQDPRFRELFEKANVAVKTASVLTQEKEEWKKREEILIKRATEFRNADKKLTEMLSSEKYKDIPETLKRYILDEFNPGVDEELTESTIEKHIEAARTAHSNFAKRMGIDLEKSGSSDGSGERSEANNQDNHQMDSEESLDAALTLLGAR